MLTRVFVRTAATANTLRYRELPAVDQPEAIGTLYLRKDVAGELGNPDRIKLAIADAAEFESGEADG